MSSVLGRVNVTCVLALLLALLVWLPNWSAAQSIADNCINRDEQTCTAVDAEARHFFREQNELLRQRKQQENSAQYAYNTNVTEENRRAMISLAAEHAVKAKELAQAIKSAGYEQSNDGNVRRMARLLADMGAEALPSDDYVKFKNAISGMQTNYATTSVCSYTNHSDCTLTLEPHIQERISQSRDDQELAWYWREWYDKAGTPMRENFGEYVKLSRKAAQLNGYRNYADYWLHFYEDAGFERQLDATYKALLPFYREMHGYVRYRLRQHYGDQVVPANGNLPMHLLGNMWAQSWENVIDLTTPYPEQPFVDIKAEMERQNWNVTKLFKLGNEFFTSLGMKALPDKFWNASVLTRPEDREIVCHASAWDFFSGNSSDLDVRIKMCTEVNMHYLYVAHHELGHIQYYMQYQEQPSAYRDAPNPGFHEAVGDVIALSVMSAKHLNRLNLTTVGRLDEKSRINELFKQALSKIVFLPFGYTMDKYRYAVFRGDLDESQWNCGFWQMRSEFGGVEPPVQRSDKDFDPPAKYHIDADVEYLRYFAAHIFQFQFHKALCRLADEYVPGDSERTLDNCDIYGSKRAGKAFSEFLSLGNSKHWKEALAAFTGETEMDPAALLEYFDPLYQWLKKENSRLGVPLGWRETNKIPSDCCGPFST